ncbi:hypothetical protein A6048_17530 [Dietzia psychralcaliphila]|uniref:Uncharacterized protein n=1 Tax=Dietzia psychralcaliphila TaxID=139021 RepID=A0AAD0NSK8_9ACTN|nr:hypothetical protein A6048_17530 [Dietzia psychralcaliphila]PTM89682.1 hypothetical protein C8N39_102526 [Dietzia psychralcaliphila]
MRETGAALWWLPVGAGGHVAIHTSRWWEAYGARREHRPSRPLFHAALEVFTDHGRHVIEMAPAWGPLSGSSGVVATGPVGLPWLGRSRLFRYEVRCLPEGEIPDRAWAPAPPTLIALSAAEADAVVGRVATIPRHTWGRDAVGVGEMWNSNSLVSWLLQTTGIDAAALCPPDHGLAPGWAAGIAAARPAGSGSAQEPHVD